MISRRSLVTGLTALIAAPALVRASSLMPVRGIVMHIGFIPGVPVNFSFPSGLTLGDAITFPVHPFDRLLDGRTYYITEISSNNSFITIE